MQNKGFVKVFAVLLTLVSLYCLSFTFVSQHYMSKAKKVANGDPVLEQEYLDSISNETVWLGATFKKVRENEISLGLDLKGGMNVILEVSVPDVIRALADHKSDQDFNEAVDSAAELATKSQEDFISLFIKEYARLAPKKKLAELFATQQLKDKVNQRTEDAEVEKVLRAEVKAAIGNSYNVLRTRIDRFGVVQPNIQTLEGSLGRIMIELPGIKEPERVRKLLQGSANLEFWETYTPRESVPFLQTADATLRQLLAANSPATEEKEATEEPTEQAEVQKETISVADSLAAALKGETKATTAEDIERAKKEHPLLSLLQPNTGGQGGAVAGYAHYKDTAEINRYLQMKEIQAIFPRDLNFKWGVSAAEFDKKEQIYELYAIRSTERDGRAPLEGDVVTDASDTFDNYNRPAVSMTMNSDGARRWAQLTKKNINKSIAIVLDDYVYSAPNVMNEITGGSSQITGNFTLDQTKDLANVLKTGKMPAPAHIVQEDIIGPSLGQASINAGIISFIIALVLLMIFMCVIYGVIPGMIANSALLLNLFFTLGILASFQAALTMSGIAGIVLALGMAVDANVLIYERIKEELVAGKGIKKSLSDGYSNAFSAIFDANLTSIITGIILFWFGTGPIRGFATTLIIGIICSFFTAVFLTRIVYEHFLAKDKFQNLTFTTSISKNILVNPAYRFVENNKKALSVTGIVLIICISAIAIRGLSQSIDFTGGRNFQVQFVNPVEPEEVRSLILDKFEGANVSVLAIGTDKRTVRISTNYRIEESSNTIDSEIEAYLYESLKPLLTDDIPLDVFIDRENYTGGSIVSSQKVGPSIAEDIKIAAIWSVVLAVFAIGLYILIRFRNIAFSVGSVVALIGDTLMILGIYALCWGWMPFSLEVDQTFIGAILTAIGYSINDKVVIFDRVREYINLYPKRGYKELFNSSLNTTLSRTINTSFSTLLVLLCIFTLGGDSIRSFSFAMILGVIFGTLSSLFVASPIAFYMLNRGDKKDKELENA
ncbi:MAG: protein translocase subunit SecDF [Bacteroides sp.]|nr:protein translocase subunit SecDF [Bacteroides sp.]